MNRLKLMLARLPLPRDPLVRLFAINGLAGVAIAGLVLGGIFAANIGNLRALVLAAENPVLPVVMLAAGLVITLSSVVIGSAIMFLGKADDNAGPGKRARVGWSGQAQPVPVRVPDRSDHLR